MAQALAHLANKSLPFHLYSEVLNGVTAEDLAQAHSLPIHWVNERVEAVRLALEGQILLTLDAVSSAELHTASVGK